MDARYNLKGYTLKDLVRIAYHFKMDVGETMIEFVYDPVAISDYILLKHYSSRYPRIIIEPASNVILFKESELMSTRYRYDPQKHKIIPN